MNLRTLAKSLALSPTTVSRALAGYADVSAATRERVQAAAQASGYRPDTRARRLATGRAEAVGIVYPLGDGGLGDARFVEVLGGLTAALADARMEMLLAAARPQTELDSHRRLIETRAVDALIVAHTRLDDPRIRLLQERGFPFLAYGRTCSPRPYAWFDFDNHGGALQATRRLLGFGHRRIGLVHAPRSLSFAAQRRAGYIQALREAGVAADPTLQFEAPGERGGGCEAVHRLLERPDPPTALLVDNHLSGIGALQGLVQRGLRPGRDVSLIVYDGVPADVPLPYRVTSVVQRTGDEAGRTMARLVLELLAGKPCAGVQHLAQPHIDPGETDGPLPRPAHGTR